MSEAFVYDAIRTPRGKGNKDGSLHEVKPVNLLAGVLTSVHDGSIGSIFGIGVPAWTGGALQFIDSMGVDAFAQRCDELAAPFGPGFVFTDAVKATLRQHRPAY